MKGLFELKPRSQSELVQDTRELLLYVDRNSETREHKREEKMCELGKSILEMRTVVFCVFQSEPNPDACAQLTREFFKEDMLRLLILCIPKLETGFFQEYNTPLLESTSYITRQHSLKDSNKEIQLETFHVFKPFVANQNKPSEIICVLVKNRSKLLLFLGDFELDKEDEQFEADKSQVMEEIANLGSNGRSCADLENCESETDF